MAPALTRNVFITLMLVTAELQVNSFVINRDETTMNPDLFYDGSYKNQAKHDIKRPNNIHSVKNEDKTVGVKPKETPDMVSMIDVALTTVFEGSEENNSTEVAPSTNVKRTSYGENKENLTRNSVFVKDKLNGNTSYEKNKENVIRKNDSESDKLNVTSLSDILTTHHFYPVQDFTTINDQLATDSEKAHNYTTDAHDIGFNYLTVATETTNLHQPEIQTEPESKKHAVTTQETYVYDSSNEMNTSDNNTKAVTKNYVTIERKRLTNSVELNQIDSHVANASTSTEPLPLQKELRDLTNSHSTTNIEVVSKPTETQPVQTESADTDTFLKTTENSEAKSISTVQSMRAGFLDFSKSSSVMTTTTAEPEYIDRLNDEMKYYTKSQNHMQTDDAITEELRREEVYNNENLVSFTTASDTVKSTSNGKKHEEGLSVQPLNQERKTTLYAISTNYKPMKKIDVQPPKPFVRDPDDNSWRNESISSLGIVFKPKNASKSFKEVLKNKTETEFQYLQEKENRSEVLDLRLRLEKIAEERKTKKQRTWKSGEVYNDSEESTERSSTDGADKRIETTTTGPSTIQTYTDTAPDLPGGGYGDKEKHKSNRRDFFRNNGADFPTAKPNKFFDGGEYYESTDDYDVDYVTLKSIDLQKFKNEFYTQSTARAPSTFTVNRAPTAAGPPARHATVQYFPPRTTTTAPTTSSGTTTLKVNFNEYDDGFSRTVEQYPTEAAPVLTTTPEPVATDRPAPAPAPATDDADKDYLDITRRPLIAREEQFNRGTYVIKHYGDFLGESARAPDYDMKMPDYVPLTSPPAPRARRPRPPPPDYEEYEAQFRREVVGRFVDTFNEQSARFKVEFPVVYNSTVLHGGGGAAGGVAASRSLLQRVYPPVELSPAYELHYYVPEQEEQELPPTKS